MTTKTIRFNDKERIIYDNWDIKMVREFKKFMLNKLSKMQKLEFKIRNSPNPKKIKMNMIKEKVEKMKFLMKKGCSKERLNELEGEIRQIYEFQI